MAAAGRFDGKDPNIVFIHAESMDGRMMGCMGHPALRNATPNLDRLAETGVLFTNAYTNCPVCNPSRASMWTGKYPNHYNCWNNHEGIRENVPTFQTTFESSGYRMAAIGPLDYSYGKHSIRDRVGSWTRSACIRRPISRTSMPQVAADGTINGGDWNRTYESIGFIRDAAAAKAPFMLYLTTGLVHPAFVGEPRTMARIHEKEIDIPPGPGPVDGTGHPVMDYIRITKNCDQPFSEDLVHQIRHIYFAMIAALDDMVGRVLCTLEDLGLSDSTYVIFSSDHGEMAGEHGQILKRTMYESSTHVPLIVRGPGVRQGAAVDTPVALIDLYPTLMDMARIDYDDHAHDPGYPETIDGESLMPQLEGTTPRQRDWAYSEYHGDRCCTGAYMLRKGIWKYVKYMGYEPQLFDLASDPGELVDLAKQELEVVKELDGILEGHFDCEGIDARAKRYDKVSFRAWRDGQKTAGTYADTMALVYSGFDRLCIEDIVPWGKEDEDVIEAWLEA